MQAQADSWLALLPLLVVVIAIPVAVLVHVLPFWFICKKAGFHGALSLLMLVPVVNIILPFILDYAEWPALKQKEA